MIVYWLHQYLIHNSKIRYFNKKAKWRQTNKVKMFLIETYFIYYVFCKLDLKNKFVDYIGLRSSIFICMVNLNSILIIGELLQYAIYCELFIFASLFWIIVPVHFLFYMIKFDMTWEGHLQESLSQMTWQNNKANETILWSLLEIPRHLHCTVPNNFLNKVCLRNTHLVAGWWPFLVSLRSRVR